MFDFQKLEVYKKSRALNKSVFSLLKATPNASRTIRDQLSRASLSISLNIAEGSGRFSRKEKRHFYVIARASLLECVAIFDAMLDSELISEEIHKKYCEHYAPLSRMLFSLIQRFSE